MLWTIGVFALNFGPVIVGPVLDYVGPKITAMLGESHNPNRRAIAGKVYGTGRCVYVQRICQHCVLSKLQNTTTLLLRITQLYTMELAAGHLETLAWVLQMNARAPAAAFHFLMAVLEQARRSNSVSDRLSPLVD